MAEKVKKPKSKARKIIEWVLFTIFAAACAVILAANVSAMINKKKNYGQSIRFGVGSFLILTDSMEPEINKGDFILTYKQDVNKFEERLANNEIIDVTFMNIQVDAGSFQPDDEKFQAEGHPTTPTNVPMTHRLREVHVNEDRAFGEGHYIFVASGINTMGLNSREGQYQIFTEAQYLGTVKSANKFLGRTMNFISSVWGLLILLLIPAVYLIVTSSIDIFKAVKEQEENENSPKVVENSQIESDRLNKMSASEKERLKNELLEEMIKEKKENKK